jgi:hypothetical protein
VPQQTGAGAAGHAHQLRQLTNGRAGLPTEMCIKRGHLPTRDSFNARYAKIKHQEEIAGSDTSRRKRLCPTAQPRCLVDRALHCFTAEDAAPARHIKQSISCLGSTSRRRTVHSLSVHHPERSSQSETEPMYDIPTTKHQLTSCYSLQLQDVNKYCICVYCDCHYKPTVSHTSIPADRH